MALIQENNSVNNHNPGVDNSSKSSDAMEVIQVYEFDNPKGDLTVCSNSGETFRLLSALFYEISPFLQKVVDDARTRVKATSTDQAMNTSNDEFMSMVSFQDSNLRLPIISFPDIETDTLVFILRAIHSASSPVSTLNPLDISLVYSVLKAGTKYQIFIATQTARLALHPTAGPAQAEFYKDGSNALKAFAVAKANGLEEETLLAAREALKHPHPHTLPGEHLPELDNLTASDYHRLADYHTRVSKTISELFKFTNSAANTRSDTNLNIEPEANLVNRGFPDMSSGAPPPPPPPHLHPPPPHDRHRPPPPPYHLTGMGSRGRRQMLFHGMMGHFPFPPPTGMGFRGFPSGAPFPDIFVSRAHSPRRPPVEVEITTLDEDTSSETEAEIETDPEAQEDVTPPLNEQGPGENNPNMVYEGNYLFDRYPELLGCKSQLCQILRSHKVRSGSGMHCGRSFGRGRMGDLGGLGMRGFHGMRGSFGRGTPFPHMNRHHERHSSLGRDHGHHHGHDGRHAHQHERRPGSQQRGGGTGLLPSHWWTVYSAKALSTISLSPLTDEIFSLPFLKETIEAVMACPKCSSNNWFAKWEDIVAVLKAERDKVIENERF